MSSTDAAFAGKIPALYDRCLVPMLFAPYAEELSLRLAMLAPDTLLETAAGTGAVTRQIAAALPQAKIVATDLNPDMLAVARQRVTADNVSFEQADAQALPFDDATFDAIVCQFGVMFYPERAASYREAHRILRPGGHYLFAVWDALKANALSLALHRAMGEAFPDATPDFLGRIPFGYSDRQRIEDDVTAAGFTKVEIETLEKRSRAACTADVVSGLCEGSPLAAQIETHGPGAMPRALEAARRALRPFEDSAGRIDGAMSALIVTASV